MRASAADPVTVLPDDCTLVEVTAFVAAAGLSERKAKSVLHEVSIPIVRLGARPAGVRLSHVRDLLRKRAR